MSEPLATVLDVSIDPESLAWRRPPVGRAEHQADLALAAVLFAASILSLVLSRAFGMYEDPAPPALSMAILAVVTLPLAWRRLRPSLIAVVVAAGFVALGELAVPETVIANIALFMSLYTVGAWEPDRRRAAWVRGAIIAVMAIWLLTSFFRVSTADLDLDGPGIGALTPVAAFMLQQLLVNALYFAGAYWFGNHAWVAARQRAVTAQRTAELGLERARVAQQAVTIERIRIARELHDAVAHHVSLMGVQAAAARAVLPIDPARAEAQIEALEDSSRSAVAELYNLVGTLRDADSEDQPPTEAPSALALAGGRIAALVAEADAAGLPVTFQEVGAPRPLPGIVSLNLYRIAQEALTNVVKHAGPGTKATVRLRHEPESVELEIADDGGGRPVRPAVGAGLGLIGMRERVESLGGTLRAGARSTSRGYIVIARVPLRADRLTGHEPHALTGTPTEAPSDPRLDAPSGALR